MRFIVDKNEDTWLQHSISEWEFPNSHETAPLLTTNDVT
jgi:hypothetical protein